MAGDSQYERPKPEEVWEQRNIVVDVTDKRERKSFICIPFEPGFADTSKILEVYVRAHDSELAKTIQNRINSLYKVK